MPKELIVCSTVDWEGDALKPENIAVIQDFNKKYPHVPLTHYICPAYFTRGYDNKKVAQTIRSAIKEGDEVALHIHCWDSLVSHCGVEYIETPTWNAKNGKGTGVPMHGTSALDYGHDVPLGVYKPGEIDLIIDGSRALLAKVGLISDVSECTGFRCGGWVACDAVLESLTRRRGFEHEASGAPHVYFGKLYTKLLSEYGFQLPLLDWLKHMWGSGQVTAPYYLVNTHIHRWYPDGVVGFDPSVTTVTQPFHDHHLGLVEIPDTGALADYTTRALMHAYVDRAMGMFSSQDEVYISLGFHDINASEKNHFDPSYTNIEVFEDAIAYIHSVTDTAHYETRGGYARTLTQRDACGRPVMSFG